MFTFRFYDKKYPIQSSKLKFCIFCQYTADIIRKQVRALFTYQMAVISMYYLYHDSLHLKVTHESTPVFIVLLIMNHVRLKRHRWQMHKELLFISLRRYVHVSWMNWPSKHWHIIQDLKINAFNTFMLR